MAVVGSDNVCHIPTLAILSLYLMPCTLQFITKEPVGVTPLGAIVPA